MKILNGLGLKHVIVSVAILMSYISSAQAEILKLPYDTYEGEASSFKIKIGDQLVDTGTIKYSLDKSVIANSFMSLDFDTMSAQQEIDLLATSVVIESLGLQPIQFRSIETGSFIVTQITSESYDVDVSLKGSFTATDPNSIFGGITWTNRKRSRGRISGGIPGLVGGEYEWEDDGEGEVEQPSCEVPDNLLLLRTSQCGGDVTFTGDGGGSGQPVPEPLTILGSVAALGFGAYAERKRKLSNSSEKDDTKDS